METPIGLVPTGVVARLGRPPARPPPSGRGCCGVDRAEWAAEVPEIRAFFERFGGRLPAELERSLSALEQDLTRVAI